MQILTRSFTFAASLTLVSLTQADSVPMRRGASENGEQRDERQHLVKRMLETSLSLAKNKTDYVGDESDLEIRLALLAGRLRQSSTPKVQRYRVELRDLQAKLTLHETDVKKHLTGLRATRELWMNYVPFFRKQSKGVLPDLAKRMEEQAQAYEKGARELAKTEARVAKEVSTREDLSRILADLAKLLDDSRHRGR